MNRMGLFLLNLLRGARGIYTRMSRIQRIFLLLGIVVLIAAATMGFVRFRDNEPEIELMNMDGITYLLRGFWLENDELTAALTEAHSLLRQKLSLPVFSGEVVIVFDPDVKGSGEVRRLSSRRRELRLSSAMNGFGIQKRDLVHELVHISWQADSIHERYPLLAIEGIAQALAYLLVAPESSRLIDELNDFYFHDLTGLIDPDEDLNEMEEWRQLLSYELAAKLFIEIDKIDPSLIPKLLKDTPEQDLDWLDFCKRVVLKSDAPDEVRRLLNSCRVFSGPLPEEYYIIPLRKPQSESITVGIFLPSMISQGPIRIEYNLQDNEERTFSDEKLLFFDERYSQFEIQRPDDIVTFDVSFIYSRTAYSKTFHFSHRR